jgi:hypothetical protein
VPEAALPQCDASFVIEGARCVPVPPGGCNDPTACTPNGRCEALGSGSRCVCDPGYQSDGMRCVATPTTCAVDRGGCEEVCTQTTASARTCSCNVDGVLKADGKSCARWGVEVPLSSDHPQNARVAIDGLGNSIVVWDRALPSGQLSIWASRAAPNMPWSAPSAVQTAARYAQSPQVAVDGQGNAIAIWLQAGDNENTLWAKRFSVATNMWQAAPVALDTGAGTIGEYTMASDPAGRAVVLFEQYPSSSGARTDIWSRFFDPERGFSAPQLVESDDSGRAEQGLVGLDGRGNSVALFRQLTVEGNRIFASTAKGQTWAAARAIDGGPIANEDAQLAVGANGSAIAVWTVGEMPAIWSARYDGSSWGQAEMLPIASNALVHANSFRSPRAAIAANGTIVVTWRERLRTDGGGELFAIVAAVHDGTSWAAPVTLSRYVGRSDVSAQPPDGPYNPQVALDRAGNGLVLWQERDGASELESLWTARYSVAEGFGAPFAVTRSGRAGGVDLAMNAEGSAVVVWTLFGEESSALYSRRFE